MDKIIAYQNIIADLLKEYRSYLSNANLREKDDRFKIVIDNENQHYQLLVMGWKENKYRFNILLHLNIEDNKILGSLKYSLIYENRIIQMKGEDNTS